MIMKYVIKDSKGKFSLGRGYWTNDIDKALLFNSRTYAQCAIPDCLCSLQKAVKVKITRKIVA